jgi:hypothetical protein
MDKIRSSLQDMPASGMNCRECIAFAFRARPISHFIITDQILIHRIIAENTTNASRCEREKAMFEITVPEIRSDADSTHEIMVLEKDAMELMQRRC